MIPLSKEEIEDIFLDLRKRLAFKEILCGIWCVSNIARHAI